MADINYRKEQIYQVTMNIARQLLDQGIISEDEYAQIDTIFTEKYDVTFGRLFTDLSLI